MAKVLIAESTCEKEDFCKKNLVSEGYEILDAKNCQDAISMFIEGRPDVVILDRNLGSSGVDIAEDILFLNHSARIIMNSKKGEVTREDENVGVELFLPEPLTREGLISSVQTLSNLRYPMRLVAP
jgi:DNA-binding response OmpR family regulator